MDSVSVVERCIGRLGFICCLLLGLGVIGGGACHRASVADKRRPWSHLKDACIEFQPLPSVVLDPNSSGRLYAIGFDLSLSDGSVVAEDQLLSNLKRVRLVWGSNACPTMVVCLPRECRADDKERLLGAVRKAGFPRQRVVRQVSACEYVEEEGRIADRLPYEDLRLKWAWEHMGPGER
jgi:hypothetical protein